MGNGKIIEKSVPLIKKTEPGSCDLGILWLVFRTGYAILKLEECRKDSVKI